MLGSRAKTSRFGSRAKAPGFGSRAKAARFGASMAAARRWPLGSAPGHAHPGQLIRAQRILPWRRGACGAVPFSGAQGGQAYLGKCPHVCRLRCVRIAFGAVFIRASPAGEECLRHMLQIQAMKVGVKPRLLQAGHDAVSKFANTLAAGNVPGGRQSFRGGGRAASRRGLRFGVWARHYRAPPPAVPPDRTQAFRKTLWAALCLLRACRLSLAYILLPPRCSAAGLVRQHYRCCGACTPYSRYHRTNRLKSSS